MFLKIFSLLGVKLCEHLWASLFYGHVYSFLLGVYLGVDLVSHLIGICVAFLETASFLKWLFRFILPFLPVLDVISIFNLSHSW